MNAVGTNIFILKFVDISVIFSLLRDTEICSIFNYGPTMKDWSHILVQTLFWLECLQNIVENRILLLASKLMFENRLKWKQNVFDNGSTIMDLLYIVSKKAPNFQVGNETSYRQRQHCS